MFGGPYDMIEKLIVRHVLSPQELSTIYTDPLRLATHLPRN